LRRADFAKQPAARAAGVVYPRAPQNIMIKRHHPGVATMKAHLPGLAVVLLLAAASTLHAEEAAQPPAPAASPSAPAVAPADTPPPAVVPRPSLVPKNAEPTQQPVAPQADDNLTPRRHPHYARRHYGSRYAYWQPFPFYWPHFYHNRIYWGRIRWFF
jgi:hypothetical protein